MTLCRDRREGVVWSVPVVSVQGVASDVRGGWTSKLKRSVCLCPGVQRTSVSGVTPPRDATLEIRGVTDRKIPSCHFFLP